MPRRDKAKRKPSTFRVSLAITDYCDGETVLLEQFSNPAKVFGRSFKNCRQYHLALESELVPAVLESLKLPKESEIIAVVVGYDYRLPNGNPDQDQGWLPMVGDAILTPDTWKAMQAAEKPTEKPEEKTSK